VPPLPGELPVLSWRDGNLLADRRPGVPYTPVGSADLGDL
jgi:hypothetical protein